MPWGIILEVDPDWSRDWVTVIERAPDSGGAPDTGSVVEIAELPPLGRIVHVDILPKSANRYHYRALHRLPGFTDSSATGWVSDRSRPISFIGGEPIIPDRVPEDTPTTDEDNDDGTRTHRVPYSAFTPGDDATAYTQKAGWIEPGSTTPLRLYFAPVSLPPGALITSVSARLNRADGDTSRLLLARPTGLIVGFSELLATCEHTSVGWATITDTMAGGPVSEDETFLEFIATVSTVGTISTSGEGAGLAYVDITYTQSTTSGQ